ncbi:hypothetical protein ISG33_10330 [Glaciecola sp. MH2013]|uniref:hypothetical protein n=1 Tax=Glaciecola sp. MH2013 TaxID=2785524 RepID=UPI00189DA8BC|nr:hypothetical protein [Glaciecola sp. MH2013]MBF7073794.1 hypothetical protein [Glaciecola sp. MH2013]
MKSSMIKSSDVNLAIVSKSLILTCLFSVILSAFSAFKIVEQGFSLLHAIPFLFTLTAVILLLRAKAFHGIPSSAFIVTFLTSHMIWGVIEFGFISGVIALILYCCLFLELVSSKRLAVGYIITLTLLISWFGIFAKEELSGLNQFQMYVMQYNAWLYSISSVVFTFLLLAIAIIEYHAAYQKSLSSVD